MKNLKKERFLQQESSIYTKHLLIFAYSGLSLKLKIYTALTKQSITSWFHSSKNSLHNLIKVQAKISKH